MTDPWAEHRGLLFSVAYDLLGSVADAEDVVQETWLRWSAADRGDVMQPAGVPRPDRDHSGAEPDPQREGAPRDLHRPVAARAADRAGPGRGGRRAGRPRARSVACDARRARDAVAGRARRLRAARGVRHVARRDRGGARPHPGERAAVGAPGPRARPGASAALRVRAGRAAPGDQRVPGRLCDRRQGRACSPCWRPDVTLVSDSDGRAKAARRPILGADKVARFMIGIARGRARARRAVRARQRRARCRRLRRGHHPDRRACSTSSTGRIQNVYIVANPEKLAHVRG